MLPRRMAAPSLLSPAHRASPKVSHRPITTATSALSAGPKSNKPSRRSLRSSTSPPPKPQASTSRNLSRSSHSLPSCPTPWEISSPSKAASRFQIQQFLVLPAPLGRPIVYLESRREGRPPQLALISRRGMAPPCPLFSRRANKTVNKTKRIQKEIMLPTRKKFSLGANTYCYLSRVLFCCEFSGCV